MAFNTDAVLLNEILGLKEDESVFLAEESLEDLITLPVTLDILSTGIDHDAAIEVWGEGLLGIAFRLKEPEGVWLLLTDRYSKRKVLAGLFDKNWEEGGNAAFEGPSGEHVRTSEASYLQALVEYFSISLAEELFCEVCTVPSRPFQVSERVESLEAFLEPVLWPGQEIMEVCCGSGIATQALMRMGFEPWAMDSDRCDICQGLKGSYLRPESSFVLDARLLDRFFPSESFDVVLGFMVGLIDDVNWDVWKEVILRSSSLARETVLYTVYSEGEAEHLASALEGVGWDGEIIDNKKRTTIYDQWAYLGRRVK